MKNILFFASTFLLAGAAFANPAAEAFADDRGCEISYWAPGIVNQAEGTVELDVAFRVPSEGLFDDYQNLFNLSGNGGPGR
jgi:hypothetical protein